MPSYLRVEREDEPCNVRSKSISKIAYIHSQSSFATDQEGTQKPPNCNCNALDPLKSCGEKGMAIGQGGADPKDGVFAPTLHGFVLPCFCRALYDGENFLTPFPPLGASQNPVSPYKALFLVNLPTTIIIFFNKTCFINKNILEITKKFVP